jgi:hypothetical protein
MLHSYKEIEEIKWENIWDNWINYTEIYEPKLRNPIEIKRIYVNYKKEGYFQGYDWINKNDFQERVKYVKERPIEFLYFGESLNKGTLHTLELLDQAKDNQEERAAIWIAAFTKDILDSMPDEWNGKGYSILHKVYWEAQCKIDGNDDYYLWHHAMRKLLPEICFSYKFLENLNVNSYKLIVEISVINEFIRESPTSRYGKEQVITPRLGQAAFRVVVTEAYNRKCSVTGEKTLPVLDVAHIKPFSQDGPNVSKNGILLRTDIHTLFDKGYITINENYIVEVSKRLHEDYGNGKIYYAYHGKQLSNIPDNQLDLPEKKFLRWHNENVYLG